MGFIQTAFAASQILGLPLGIYLSKEWNWHVPYLALAAMSLCWVLERYQRGRFQN